MKSLDMGVNLWYTLIIVERGYKGPGGPEDGTMNDFTQTIREMMTQWDKYRAMWITRFGSDDGFQEWFTAQVLNA